MSCLEAHPIADLHSEELSESAELAPTEPLEAAPAEKDQSPIDEAIPLDEHASPGVISDAPRTSAALLEAADAPVSPATAALPPKAPHSKATRAEVCDQFIVF